MMDSLKYKLPNSRHVVIPNDISGVKPNEKGVVVLPEKYFKELGITNTY